MYLIRAEAILNRASVSGVTALSDFNAIRTNRGLIAATSVNLAELYKERRRELCFEGNELFDLARTQRSLVRVDYTGLTNKDITFVAGGRLKRTTCGQCLFPSQKLMPMSIWCKTLDTE